MAEPAFRYDAATNRYRSTRSGRYVARKEIRAAVDTVLDAGQLDARGLAAALRDRKLALDEWELGMRRLVKNAHLSAAAAALGGWDRLAPADFGRVGAAVRDQYAYLRKFSAEVAAGLPLDGRFASRATLYAEAARKHYHQHERAQMLAHGYDEERNVLHDADHCDGCLEATDAGWVPIGELPPIGTRDCMARCRCTLEYRSSGARELEGG